MEPNALHIWPRSSAMMIALPNRDRSFTATLFWPFTGDDHSFDSLEGSFTRRRAADPAALATPEERRTVHEFFARVYPDAPALMPTLVDDFFRNPTSSLVTIRCGPWGGEERFGSAALLGDAAHAVVPFYGQGMNAAFEDVVCLTTLLRSHSRIPDAIARYAHARKPNADAIADMAIENFVEMRDLAARPDFQHRKRIEQALHRLLGDAVTPQYNLVSFSTVPYSLAQRRGREMDALLRQAAPLIPPRTTPPDVPDPEWDRAVLDAARPLLHTITPIPADASADPIALAPSRHAL